MMLNLEETMEDRKWRFFEVFFLVTVLLNPLLVCNVAFFSNDERFSEMAVSQRMSCLAAAVIYSLFAWAMRLSGERFPAILTNRIRDAVFVPIVLWLVVLAYVIMPRGDFTESQRAVVSLWGFAPFGMLVGWLWAFTIAGRKKVCIARA